MPLVFWFPSDANASAVETTTSRSAMPAAISGARAAWPRSAGISGMPM